MPAKNSRKRLIRREQRQANFKARVPEQPAGFPRGQHLTGFKGVKVDQLCFCGGCYVRNKDRVEALG